jgi:hypothetical protein
MLYLGLQFDFPPWGIEHKLRKGENTVLREYLNMKIEDVKGGLKELQNMKRHIVQLFKSDKGGYFR